MKILVQKYGGTSVEDKSRLENVADIIVKDYNKGNSMVVVVSAQGKTTNLLENKAKEIEMNIDSRERDMLLSTGEMQTVSLLSLILKKRGYKVIGLTGEQAGIITNSEYGNARIETIYTDYILNKLKDGYIVVVAGFQGVDKMGNITTLGRGGSDLTAVALASCLKAKRCEVYTDVDGIFSADPRVVFDTKLLKSVTYDELLELATAGAKVMHNRAVEVGKKYNVPIHVKSSVTNKEGSIVADSREVFEGAKINVITKNDNVSRITLVGYGIINSNELFKKTIEILSDNNIIIYMVNISEISISILVDRDKSELAVRLLHSYYMKK